MITTQYSQFKTNNAKNNKGFSLLEVLIAAFILSFISLAIFKTLDISILSSNLSNSLVSDADLKIAVHNVLKPEQCNRNLNPSNLNDISPISKTIDSLKKYKNPDDLLDNDGVELIKINERFRDYLDIVKIELAGPDTDTQREFKVYYKRNRVKHLSTREKKPCDSTDQSGCYVNKCNLEYEVTGTDVTTCTVLDCFNVGTSNNAQMQCYSVENNNVLAGCGSTQNIGGNNIIAIGYDIGRENLSVSGSNHIFIGGPNHTTTVGGASNQFFGGNAGSLATVEGIANSFFGQSAGYQSKVEGDRNSFFGQNAANNSTVKGGFNSFFGQSAGYQSTVEGISNSFFGQSAGYQSTVEGISNSFFGQSAGYQSTVEGDRNSFFGPRAGDQSKVKGNFNSFFGYEAGESATVGGDGNQFFGIRVGHNAEVLGDNNLFIGGSDDVGYNSKVTGDDNTFIGHGAGYRGNNSFTEINASGIINIGSVLLMKGRAILIDNTAYNLPAGEVRINGNLKICNGTSNHCKAVVKEDSQIIRDLQDKINKICSKDSALCQ